MPIYSKDHLQTFEALHDLILRLRYKQEERKEIIGEEWRKISRIFDRWNKPKKNIWQVNHRHDIRQNYCQWIFWHWFRFLLVLFTAVSLITTIICIYASPHFPDPGQDHFFLETTCRPSPDLSCMQLHNWLAPSSLPQATAATLTLASSTSIRTSARKSSKRADEKSCLRIFYSGRRRIE